MFWGKNKKKNYDPSNPKCTDLRVGSAFDYDLRTWTVTEAYEYDWGGHNFSFDFKVTDGTETFFLSVEDENGVSLWLSHKIRMSNLSQEVTETLQNDSPPPPLLEAEDKEFYYDQENPGSCREMGKRGWEDFLSWDYFTKDGQYNLTIEQWGETTFEAWIGKQIPLHEISNILIG